MSIKRFKRRIRSQPSYCLPLLLACFGLIILYTEHKLVEQIGIPNPDHSLLRLKNHDFNQLLDAGRTTRYPSDATGGLFHSVASRLFSYRGITYSSSSNNNACGGMMEAPMSEFYITPKCNESIYTDSRQFLCGRGMAQEGDEDYNAVCDFHDYTENTNHFAHAMEILYRCFSFWHETIDYRKPILVYDEIRSRQTKRGKSSNGISSLLNFIQPLPKQDTFVDGFLSALQEVYGVSIVTSYSGPAAQMDRNAFALQGAKDTRLLSVPILTHYNRTYLFQEAESRRQRLLPKVAILNRKAENYRSILNADIIAKELVLASNYFTQFTVAPTKYFESTTFLEQAEFFASVDIIISPHGAQLTGLPFMPPCGAVMELFPKGYYVPDYYGSLADSSELTHSFFYVSEGEPYLEHMQQSKTLKGRKKARNTNFCLSSSKIVQAVQQLIQGWKQCQVMNANNTDFSPNTILKSSDWYDWHQYTLPVVFTEARRDRSGASIHDMLMAHAYAFHQNATYGGACIQSRNYMPEYQKDAQRLWMAVGLGDILKYDCPQKGLDDPSIVPLEHYRLDELLTPDWIRFIQRRIEYPPKRTGVYTIAVHIRRGDAEPCGRERKRYMPNSFYLKLIEQYLPTPSSKVSGSTVEVTIFSESSSFESLDVFRTKKYLLALDTDIGDVWRHMMVADVVILSKSSFSLVPAILNRNGTIVYTPFWHKNLSHWHVVENSLLEAAELEVADLVAKKCPKPFHLFNNWRLSGSST